jgi:GrpB-like predicted nucleotidyltransferase (UPF0157 family)
MARHSTLVSSSARPTGRALITSRWSSLISRIWERLFFRHYLIAHPETAQDYLRLKLRLAAADPNDREAYTNGKTEFIAGIMRE